MKNFLRHKLYILFFLIFFIPAFLTISDYNINWDEPEHFYRGQGYLRYFLTGERNYDKLPFYKDFQTYLSDRSKKSDIKLPRYSLYQNSILDGEYYLTQATGHPPLGGVLASLTNYIFYQKLGILGDVESYHLLIILGSSLLVFLISFWTFKEYGVLASVISVLSLTLTPLFFAETHVNIKDPLEIVFFSLTIYFFYMAITRKEWKWIIFSSLSFGVGLGTKFNILFLPFILLPWVLLNLNKTLVAIKKFWFAFVIFPLISFSVFFISYPYLWPNPIKRTLEVFGYYKSMGAASSHAQPESFYFLGFNSYPFQTVLFTTPVIILFLTFFGILYVLIKGRKEKNKTSFLILLWFVFPILRVTMPGTSIYGGVRQIMEYIPAMAILAGIGADYLVRTVHGFLFKPSLLSSQKSIPIKSGSKIKSQNYNSKFKKLLYVLVILSFLPITLKLISIHPNENVYFNPLIGGLKGAAAKDYPYWGFNLGSSYKQGVDWLNKNAEKNTKVAMVVATGQNIPKTYFRSDIEFYNGAWSGTQRKGEYLIEAVFNGWIREWHYDGEYVDKVLKPVYEVKVDDVPILKVWKNDKEHTDPRFLEEKLMPSEKIKWEENEDSFIVSVKDAVDLTKVSIFYESNNCSPFKSGLVFLSTDGTTWTFEKEPIREAMLEDNKFIYSFVGKRAKYLKIKLDSKNACEYSVKNIIINHL